MIAIFVHAAFAVSLAAVTPDLHARTVVYNPAEIVPLHARMRFTTVIVLPGDEQIADFIVGDKTGWRLEGADNVAYLKPRREGASSDVSLVCSSGNIYSFYVNETTTGGGPLDLKLMVQHEPSAKPAKGRLPLPFIDGDKGEAPIAKPTQEPQSIEFAYEFARDKKPFRVTAIYHDGKFTYIHCEASEKPALYEIRDGQPAVVNYDLVDGVYIVGKVLDRGYLAIGKNKLEFERTR